MKITLQIKVAIYVDVDVETKDFQTAFEIDRNEILLKVLKPVFDRVVDWDKPELIGLIKQGE